MTEHGHTSRHEPSDSVLALISPEFVAMLWRRKWHLALPVAIALALGFAYLLRVHPTYNVQARVLVERQGMPLEQERPSPRNDAFLATQAEIIRSPAVVARAAASLPARLIATDGVDPAAMILDSLTVKPVLGTNVLSVGFASPDEARGIQTVEAIIASYREYLRKSDHDSHIESLGLLTREERELRGDLNEQERQYLQLRQNSALLGQGADAAAVQLRVVDPPRTAGYRRAEPPHGTGQPQARRRQRRRIGHVDAVGPSVAVRNIARLPAADANRGECRRAG